ncbi:hypothetical protein DEU56DRAFT_71776 [Suillus clintonianus]|uniref:uncharacterized protein n=1 Tax=Suillus clintonianus TaxID=1904413 RepID=UPI001B8703A6|nr:uncharacterized protein DEU56DRAFT_71776 [Suillus clintonianus]KAG2122569.1 hypothetical protein DEU56DRAFT_71776 [Suillus clintonianus]
MGIPLDKAAFLALFLQTSFYGVFLTLYWLTLFVLLKKTGIQRQLLVPVATLLLFIATAHLIIDFVRALEAFVFKVDTVGADAYYSNLASPLALTSLALYITQTTIADGVVVWRCYILYDRTLFIAIPACLVLLTYGISGYYVVWSLSRTHPLRNTFASITTFYALTMLISVACTILISWRIYRTRRFIPDGLAAFLPVFIVVVESGALYSTSVLALLIATSAGSNAQYIMLSIIPPIVGITFCLIILQVHFHIGGNPPSEQPTKPRSTIISLLRERGVRDADFSMEPISVRTTEETEIVQLDLMWGKNSQPDSGGVFQV